MKNIDTQLQNYRLGLINWSDFCRAAQDAMCAMLHRPLGIPMEEHAEILSDFYPRLVRMSREYRAKGSCFEAYLFTALRYFLKTRHRNARAAERQTDTLLGCLDPDEAWTDEPIYEYQGCHDERQIDRLLDVGSRSRDTLRRQLIISLCKNLPVLRDHEIESYARTFDLPKSWIRAAIVFAESRTRQTCAETTRFREHRDRHYSAMVHQQAALAETAPMYGSSEPTATPRKLAFHRSRWHYYQRRIRRQNVHLSNREVAEFLGIPKGSVDSGLHSLAKRLAALQKKRLGSTHANASTGDKQFPQALGV